MQIFKDKARQYREIWFGREHFSARLQLRRGGVQKIDWALQVMQHISKCDHIEAIIFDNSQLVDLVAIKNQIEIVKIENVTCDDVRVKLFEW